MIIFWTRFGHSFGDGAAMVESEEIMNRCNLLLAGEEPRDSLEAERRSVSLRLFLLFNFLFSLQ